VRRLDEVNWADLDDAYGTANDLPDLLRSLADGEMESVGEIYGALCHQGTRYSASAAAVPYLADILATADVDAVPVLMTLGSIAIGDLDWYAFPVPEEARGGSYPDAVAAYRAVAAQIPVVARFTTSEDEQISAAAMWVLARFPGQAEETLPAVLAARPSATRAIAAGLLGHAGPGSDDWADAVEAMCAGGRTWAADVILGHARKPEVLFDERIPFMFGNIAGILAGALSLLPVERLPEAISVARTLEDRAQPDGMPVRHFLRIMTDRHGRG
jgi:hypothetical protein